MGARIARGTEVRLCESESSRSDEVFPDQKAARDFVASRTHRVRLPSEREQRECDSARAAPQYHTFTTSAMSLNLPSNMPTFVVTNLMSISGWSSSHWLIASSM